MAPPYDREARAIIGSTQKRRQVVLLDQLDPMSMPSLVPRPNAWPGACPKSIRRMCRIERGNRKWYHAQAHYHASLVCVRFLTTPCPWENVSYLVDPLFDHFEHAEEDHVDQA